MHSCKLSANEHLRCLREEREGLVSYLMGQHCCRYGETSYIEYLSRWIPAGLYHILGTPSSRADSHFPQRRFEQFAGRIGRDGFQVLTAKILS